MASMPNSLHNPPNSTTAEPLDCCLARAQEWQPSSMPCFDWSASRLLWRPLSTRSNSGSYSSLSAALSPSENVLLTLRTHASSKHCMYCFVLSSPLFVCCATVTATSRWWTSSTTWPIVPQKPWKICCVPWRWWCVWMLDGRRWIGNQLQSGASRSWCWGRGQVYTVALYIFHVQLLQSNLHYITVNETKKRSPNSTMKHPPALIEPLLPSAMSFSLSGKSTRPSLSMTTLLLVGAPLYPKKHLTIALPGSQGRTRMLLNGLFRNYTVPLAQTSILTSLTPKMPLLNSYAPFDREYKWNTQMVQKGQSWRWHEEHSLNYTVVLGFVACRVCSKTLGIGPCERSWGNVKNIKTEKRSYLSGETTMKQAII